jgi:phosphoglycolate phosphatase
MPINLVIFDLDGTLVDTRVDINIALNHALATIGLPGISVEKTVGYVGEGVRKLIEKALADAGAGASGANIGILPLVDLIQPVMDSFLAYYASHISDNSYAYPGVVETLDALKNRKKVVATNKKDDLTEKLLDSLGLSRHFDLVLGPEKVSAKKPSPAPLIKAMDTLGCLPAETIMVGDSAFDLEAAERAGIKTVFAAYGYGGGATPCVNGGATPGVNGGAIPGVSTELARRADYVIRTDMRELLPIIEALN